MTSHSQTQTVTWPHRANVTVCVWLCEVMLRSVSGCVRSCYGLCLALWGHVTVCVWLCEVMLRSVSGSVRSCYGLCLALWGHVTVCVWLCEVMLRSVSGSVRSTQSRLTKRESRLIRDKTSETEATRRAVPQQRRLNRQWNKQTDMGADQVRVFDGALKGLCRWSTSAISLLHTLLTASAPTSPPPFPSTPPSPQLPPPPPTPIPSDVTKDGASHRYRRRDDSLSTYVTFFFFFFFLLKKKRRRVRQRFLFLFFQGDTTLCVAVDIYDYTCRSLSYTIIHLYSILCLLFVHWSLRINNFL